MSALPPGISAHAQLSKKSREDLNRPFTIDCSNSRVCTVDSQIARHAPAKIVVTRSDFVLPPTKEGLAVAFKLGRIREIIEKGTELARQLKKKIVTVTLIGDAPLLEAQLGQMNYIEIGKTQRGRVYKRFFRHSARARHLRRLALATTPPATMSA